jgi:hypothetical protein
MSVCARITTTESTSCKVVAAHEAKRSHEQMSANHSDHVSPMIKIALWGAIIAMALIQVFLSFRGLNSEAAMDQAQIARQLARGEGFSTRALRPAIVQQLTQSGRTADLRMIPDTTQPPLQPLVWAPFFKALSSKWEFDTKNMVYVLDRVAACLGAFFMLLTLLLTHGIARRMFDANLANFSVLALALSKPLWDVFLTAGARGLLVFECTAVFYVLMHITRRSTESAPLGLLPWVLGLLMASALLTHWLAIWIVIGVVIAIAWLLPSQRLTLVLAAIIPLMALIAWGTRNAIVCGDMLGGTKALLQSALTTDSPSMLLRDYDRVTPPVHVSLIIRELHGNFTAQIQHSWEHLMSVVPALLFFLAVMHRFRRQDVSILRMIAAIVVLTVLLGMSFFALKGHATDDAQTQVALVPIMTIFGLAGFAVAWGRLMVGRANWWSQQGYAVLLLAIGGLPMIMNFWTDLGIGMFYKNSLMHWPPYRPVTTAALSKVIHDDEVLASDAPWPVTWYADRSCLWLPKTREQFERLTKLGQSQSHPIAGWVITPACTKDHTLISQANSEFSDWNELIMWGPVKSAGADLKGVTPWLRDFPSVVPLGAFPMPNDRPNMSVLTLFTTPDRVERSSKEAKR